MSTFDSKGAVAGLMKAPNVASTETTNDHTTICKPWSGESNMAWRFTSVGMLRDTPLLRKAKAMLDEKLNTGLLLSTDDNPPRYHFAISYSYDQDLAVQFIAPYATDNNNRTVVWLALALAQKCELIINNGNNSRETASGSTISSPRPSFVKHLILYSDVWSNDTVKTRIRSRSLEVAIHTCDPAITYWVLRIACCLPQDQDCLTVPNDDAHSTGRPMLVDYAYYGNNHLVRSLLDLHPSYGLQVDQSGGTRAHDFPAFFHMARGHSSSSQDSHVELMRRIFERSPEGVMRRYNPTQTPLIIVLLDDYYVSNDTDILQSMEYLCQESVSHGDGSGFAFLNGGKNARGKDIDWITRIGHEIKMFVWRTKSRFNPWKSRAEKAAAALSAAFNRITTFKTRVTENCATPFPAELWQLIFSYCA